MNGRKIGIVSEITNQNGDRTFLTQIIGTTINGFYAQFAITKTLEQSISPNPTVVPQPSSMSISLGTDDFDAALNDDKSNLINSEPDDESISSDSLNDSNDSSPTTTESLENEKIQIDSNINEDADAENPMIDDSWLTIEEVKNEAAANTPSKSAPQSQSIEPVYSFASKSSIFGTYIGGIYAHLAKTRSEIISGGTLGAPTSISNPLPSLQMTSTSTSTTLPFPSFDLNFSQTISSSITDSSDISKISDLFIQSLASIDPSIPNSSSSSSPSSSSSLSSSCPCLASFQSCTLSPNLHKLSLASLVGDPISSISILSSNVTETLEPIRTSSLFENDSIKTQSSSTSTSSSSSSSSSSSLSSSTTLSSSFSSSVAWPSLQGLSSISHSTGIINESILAVFTTEFYTTQINGFTAHYSRDTSNIIGTIQPTTTTSTISTTTRPSIHFPTPVRYLFSSRFTTSSALLPLDSSVEIGLIPSESLILDSDRYKPIYDNSDYYNNDDEELYMAKSSFGQLPRSRTIREKDDTQPIVDYDDVDYVDRIDPISTSTTTTSSPQRNPIRNSFISNRRGFNSGAGFGQRVGSTGGRLTIAKSSMETRTEMIETRNPPPLIVANNNRGILARRRKPISRANQQSPTNENNNPTSVSVSPTRSLENSNLDNHSNQPKTSNEDQSSIVMNRQRSFNDQRRSSSSSSFSISNQNNRGPRGRGRAFQLTTATTTTTTSSPRSNINLLPSQRLRLNRKYSRNRFSQFNNQNRHNSHNNNNNINNNNNNNTPYHRQQHHRNLSNQRSSDLQSSSHDQIRKFGRSGLIGRNVGHHFRNQVLQPSVAASISQPEINYPTETIPKVPITITSIATTVKTVPIFHGFRTSYATLTTTTLNTSVIGSTQYELSILEDGITKTLFTKMTDLIEPNKVTEIIVTTSSLQEVKLVPIKFGYSTRTETLTDIKTFTMLSTVVKTNPIGLFSSLAPTIHGALSLITTSYVTTHTLSSTTSVSLLLHGKTLVSTLTFTSVAEETVTKTLTVPANSEDQSQSVSNPQASPLVTMLTLSIRGENGEVTELITAITVPIQAPIAPTIVATKVERDIRPTEHPSSIRDDGYDENREHQFDDDDVDDDYGPIVLETSIDNNNNKYNNNKNNHFNVQNSNFNANNFNYFQSRMDRDPKRNPPNLLISTSFKAIDSQLISQESNLHPNLFITTIFKGPNTEIYEANALLIDQDQSSNSDSKENNDIGGERGQNRFGTRDTLFRKRRLLQFTDNLYKESTNENRAPVERSNKVNKKFQRIRIKQSKPSSASSSTSPNDFHRLVGLSENPASFSSIDAINSFRRQPVLVDQSQFNLYSSVVMSIPTVSSSASYLLANNFQKPTYRKIKPNPNQSRRLVSSARGASIEPSHVLTSGFLLGPTTKTTFIEVPNHFNHHLQQPSSYQQLSSPLGLHHNSNKRVIQHANRAILPHRNPINHFNVPNSLDDQLNPLTYQPMIIYDTGSLPTYPQPIENEFDIANQNHLASMRYSRVRPTSVTSVATPETSTIHTPTIPLTYYTTFTYLTTVIRGQHTAHLSRESVTSAITTKALDKSIVEMVRDNDGIIEPTRLQELGTKTKGLATTIYNALYQVQIYNEDLYKVIQKTYNKEVSFKRWKPTTTAYQPVFVTNHVDFPKESPLLSTIEATPTISENEFDLIRKTHSVLDSSRIVPSFVVDEDNLILR
ncbi:hypothetical protein QR98_0047980 [Sarcoptes scabiei]|uniref:DUF4758 domain-containing protein n=1 Tax=Sarcoptes scabiei TaxID=52283 RepID=A0A132A5W1_SARSC|nr:hypothetical protein QR98_0047980 [Sarcoptes scabiei]